MLDRSDLWCQTKRGIVWTLASEGRMDAGGGGRMDGSTGRLSDKDRLEG